jgi:glycine/D-amino acid oxidase-like deaminating enzyme
MDLTKSIDYLNPSDVNERIHIIGCGSVGSTVAENLARLGLTKFTLYDFDKVEARNLANQMFTSSDIKAEKIDAVKRITLSINPDAEQDIVIKREGYKGQRLNGYVFLCVDNIDLRRKIAEKNKANMAIKAMFDFRTRLEDAQHYAANWRNPAEITNFIKSMQFSHEEAHAATPVTACNVEMGVAPTVRSICALGVSNFMNFVRTGNIKKMIVMDAFNFSLEAY